MYVYFHILKIKHSVKPVTKSGTQCTQEVIEVIVLNKNINQWHLRIAVWMAHREIYV